MERVKVLMSVWNSAGNPYWKEQLESIHAQEGVDVDLLVRDDGSSDSTISVLQQEQEAGRLSWYQGENMGPGRSFLDLLAHAGGAAFYAFSDHDDVWLPEKLRVATEALHDVRGPALYFCQTKLVDAELRPLPQVPIHPRLTYGEALVYQFIGGCTMVMNEALRRVVATYSPRYLRMHDIWIYDIALAIGAKVVFDPTPHILYRQHGHNNVVPSGSRWIQWSDRWRHLRQGEHIRRRTAEELLRGFGPMMTPENRELTERVAHCNRSLSRRLRLVFDSRLTPARPLIGLTGRLAILFNQL